MAFKNRDRAMKRNNQLSEAQKARVAQRALNQPVKVGEIGSLLARMLAGPMTDIETMNQRMQIHQASMVRLLTKKGLVTEKDIEEINEEIQAELEAQAAAQASAQLAAARAAVGVPEGAAVEKITEPAPEGAVLTREVDAEAVPNRMRLVEG